MNVQIFVTKVKNGFVYAKVVKENGELEISATIDYCISACKKRGYTILNAQEVLEWLNYNVEFKA